MKILLTPEEWTLRYYPQNNYDTNYKLSNYIVKKECGNEIVLLHTITWSIYALTKEEFDNILTNETLRRTKVVVPESLDELEVAHKVYLDRLTPTGLPTLEGINDFTVLTTTSCNARCFYCYEKDLGKKQTMTLDTAEDVLQLILRIRDINNPNLNIQWFGGEPLLNKRVIEYITDRLYELNVPFSTSMITNGFLLDEETVKKFNYWKIRMVQLTFDGLEEEYNEIKNFIYSDVDAYLTLINNIHNLLKYTTARIVVKFNATNENIFKIYDYIKYLQEEYSCHENHHQIHYAVSTLFEYIKDPDLVIDGYWDEFYRIGEIADVRVPNIRDKILSEETYRRKPINFQCKAYDGRTFIIMPNMSKTEWYNKYVERQINIFGTN